MKSKSKKSALNFSTALIYKLVVIVVGLLLPKLFITSYGSELNGLHTSVRQIFTYIALLEAGVGAATLQSLYKPVAMGDHGKSNSYLSAATSYYNKIGVLYFVVLCGMATVYMFAVPVSGITKVEVFIYTVVSGALTGVNFFYLAKLKLLISAEGDQYIVSLITMITYIVSSAAKIALIYLEVNIILVEAVFLAVNIVSTVVYFIVAKRKYPWLSFKEKPDYSCVEQKGSVMIHRIASVVFQNADVVLLTFFCNLEIVSIYSMYKMVINMVTSIVGEIGNSINFVFGQQFGAEENDQKPKYKKLIDTFNVYYSAFSFALYTVTYIMILPFLRIYTDGMDINYIYGLLPILYIAMEFLMVGREAMMRTIEVAGHFRKTRWRTVAETVINVVASVVFILVFKNIFGDIGGIYGALLGTIAALLYRTVDINIYANRRILKRSSIKTFGTMIVNAVLFALVAAVFGSITLDVNNYLQFILYGAAITAIILPVFIVVHSIVGYKEFKYLVSFVKNKLHRGSRSN